MGQLWCEAMGTAAHRLAVTCIGAAWVASVGCRPQPPQPARARDNLDSLRRALTEAVGTASCTAKEQCRAMGVGSKPCGGPRSYLIYSMATTDSAALAVVAQRYNTAEAETNRELGRISDCTFLPPPELECAGGRCAARTSRVGAR